MRDRQNKSQWSREMYFKTFLQHHVTQDAISAVKRVRLVHVYIGKQWKSSAVEWKNPYHAERCRGDRNIPPHRRGRCTENQRGKECWDTLENRQDRRPHKPTHSHTAALERHNSTNYYIRNKYPNAIITQRTDSRQSSCDLQRTYAPLRLHSSAYAATAVHKHSQSPPESHLHDTPNTFRVRVQPCDGSNVNFNFKQRFSPAGVKDTPVVVLLIRHFWMTRAEDLLTDHRTLLLGPCHPVRVDLKVMKGHLTFTGQSKTHLCNT